MNGSSGEGMLKLAVSGGRAEDYLWQVPESVRQLPNVLRVHVECSCDRIEIIYRCPAEGLLQSIHGAMRSAGRQILSSPVQT
jgi:hypothetical protein